MDMKVVITERQLKKLLNKGKEIEIKEDDPVAAGAAAEAIPKTGASDSQSGGQGYPEVSTWESVVGSKLQRGAANQIKNTNWSDIVGTTLSRDAANQLTEQTKYRQPSKLDNAMKRVENVYKNVPKNAFIPKVEPYSDKSFAPSDYLSSYAKQQRVNLSEFRPISKNAYIKGKTLFLVLDDTNERIETTLLYVRSKLYTIPGIIAQVVFLGLGQELGASLWVGIINLLIIANDGNLFFKKGLIKPSPEEIESLKLLGGNYDWELFKYQFTHNQYFQNFIVDIAFLGTGRVLKSVKSLYQYFEKLSFNRTLPVKNGYVNTTNVFANIKYKVAEIKFKLEKIPGKLGEWVKTKTSSFDNLGQYFDELSRSGSKGKRAISQSPALVKQLLRTGAFLTLFHNFLAVPLAAALEKNEKN